MAVFVGDTTINVWTSLVRSGNRALGRIETALTEEALPPLGWYDALLEVEKAGPGGLRPFELQTRLLLPQYGMSRLLKKIETAGYIRKIPCPSDRRGHAIEITGKGADVRARMWPIYARCLTEIWQDRFSTDEISELKALLDRVAR
jgi:DNA-binding MarR family transcriptional regulator